MRVPERHHQRRRHHSLEKWAAPLKGKFPCHYHFSVQLVGGSLVEPHQGSGLQLHILVLVVAGHLPGLLGLPDHQLSSDPLDDFGHLLVVLIYVGIVQRCRLLSWGSQDPWMAWVNPQMYLYR